MNGNIGMQGNDFQIAQKLFDELKDENEAVATHKLRAYFISRGMTDEEADKALTYIDNNNDKTLSWAEFATKGTNIIYTLRVHDKAVREGKRASFTFPNPDAPKTRPGRSVSVETRKAKPEPEFDLKAAQQLFNELKNEDEVIPTHALYDYFVEKKGISPEAATKALVQIDTNNDKSISRTEMTAKGIRIIKQLLSSAEPGKLSSRSMSDLHATPGKPTPNESSKPAAAEIITNSSDATLEVPSTSEDASTKGQQTSEIPTPEGSLEKAIPKSEPLDDVSNDASNALNDAPEFGVAIFDSVAEVVVATVELPVETFPSDDEEETDFVVEITVPCPTDDEDDEDDHTFKLASKHVDVEQDSAGFHGSLEQQKGEREELPSDVPDPSGNVSLDPNPTEGVLLVATKVEKDPDTNAEVITQVQVDEDGKLKVTETRTGPNGMVETTVEEKKNEVTVDVITETVKNGEAQVTHVETVLPVPQTPPLSDPAKVFREEAALSDPAKAFREEVYQDVKNEVARQEEAATAHNTENEKTDEVAQQPVTVKDLANDDQRDIATNFTPQELVITSEGQNTATKQVAVQHELGEQPEWAGTEPCADTPPTFVDDLLVETLAVSIVKRGYAIAELPEEVTKTYSEFHAAFEAFSHLPLNDKQRYATKQFENSIHSPNQFHGFSVVGGLKEQYMMRLAGKNTDLITPGAVDETGDLGVVGMKLYELLDQLCRITAQKAAKELNISDKTIDVLLDPVAELGTTPVRDAEKCYSAYVPEGYISSSIMDNFHYYNSFNKEDQSDEKFHNNHSAHTDSGLLTVVVTTDEPGLEVYDQQLGQWIALEKLIHQRVDPTAPHSHRKYATIFWGDSVTYLKNPELKPCLHRVGKSHKERYSVVFKQRTTPLTTACRYQEDYILEGIQKEVMSRLHGSQKTPTHQDKENHVASRQIENQKDGGNTLKFVGLAGSFVAAVAIGTAAYLKFKK